MNKEEIIKKLMISENWEEVYVEYARKGLRSEKKSKLLELLGDEEFNN